tara:strand:+ start:1804 stop:2436 length:633 start_codon:yes stop_codon:yes gene_type:complete
MSINHILKDVVPDDEKLDVKFGIVEADNLEITTATFENLVVDNLGVDIGAIIESLLVRTGFTVQCPLVSTGLIRTTETVEAKAHLFKSTPYYNSSTIGVQSQLTAEETVNGMMFFDDGGKTAFTYKLPYKGDLDTYLGLSGTTEYAFRFDMIIFSTMGTGTYALGVDAVSGLTINYPGTYTKVLSHTTGEQDSYSFICSRQSDGNYIISG